MKEVQELSALLSFRAGGSSLLKESSAGKFLQELSALLSFSNKQPPVNSDFHVT